MKQTENTAIVLRYANFRENDRMLTLFSPTRGKMEVLCRGCRRPKSAFVSASELFALGDYELYHKGDHMTVIGVNLIEMFYPLRQDFDRLSVGTYLLNLCEMVIQPNENAQELFMLLLHTLSRLTFSAQDWQPLLTGFLLHFAACEGYQPDLQDCIHCGRVLSGNEAVFFDLRNGGLCCSACHGEFLAREEALPPTSRGKLSAVKQYQLPLATAQWRWMRQAMQSGSAAWVNTPEAYAPLALMRKFVEMRLGQPVRSAGMLPKE